MTPQEFRDKINGGEINQTDFGSSTDFFGDLINDDNISNYQNFSMMGGGENSSYRASAFYRNLQGIALENGRKEYGGRINVNQRGLNNRLNIQLNLATNINNANLLGGGGWESEAYKNPTLSNFNPDGTYRFDLTSTNEYARLQQETSKRKQQTSSGDIKADIDIISGLRGSIFGSFQRNSYNDSQYASQLSENSVENTDFPEGGWAAKSDFYLNPMLSNRPYNIIN
ncbi:hypothetical protein KUH03_22510 [Sphingobacterium sp. E70]|uniref:hypothetical protein n=1 Tax=Sphingobacterium sp. E70 TaxID=2853439 RepID=UPI00211C7B35|nr:hypothetical protein [Sphingobacterium sp. E70]ULT22236.1 hypothetical protein KUH03_22510 [Sphingobacterium sp. E70]